MATDAPVSEKQFKVIGTRPIRHDGLDKVTGVARYSADVHPTGMLHGKILRSPHAHARIRAIDTAKALALPGVKAVVTRDDMPEVSTGARGRLFPKAETGRRTGLWRRAGWLLRGKEATCYGSCQLVLRNRLV